MWRSLSMTSGEGCPQGFPAPAETTAVLGCTAARKAEQVEVALPWCATFRKAASSGVLPAAIVSSAACSRSPGSSAACPPQTRRNARESSFPTAPGRVRAPGGFRTLKLTPCQTRSMPRRGRRIAAPAAAAASSTSA
jgi:hypothetical protein